MKTNRKKESAKTHEGATAQCVGAEEELRRTLMTCLLFENTLYEGGETIASRLAGLVPKVKAEKVASMAVEARSEMQLRHAPLFIVRELARVKGNGPLVADLLPRIVQRADELSEFLAMYWKDKRQPLSAGVKRGLASAFGKFNSYQLAKYNRDGAVKLRDVLFLCHAKPKDLEQADVWKKLVDGTLESPDTWEVELSAGKDKKETWERLLSEGKLGGLACLRNLRNMQKVGVAEGLIRERLDKGIARALPFRFVTAARYAPQLEDAIEKAMFKGLDDMEKLKGKTAFLVDVSGSMNYPISAKSETTRIDVACGLAILLREVAESAYIATFSMEYVELPPRRGFALRDAIHASQLHTSTMLKAALTHMKETVQADRIIVITDEQSYDGILEGWTKLAYVVNVAPYQYGVSYGNGWTHIDGWSERVLDYIRLTEQEPQ